MCLVGEKKKKKKIGKDSRSDWALWAWRFARLEARPGHAAGGAAPGLRETTRRGIAEAHAHHPR